MIASSRVLDVLLVYIVFISQQPILSRHILYPAAEVESRTNRLAGNSLCHVKQQRMLGTQSDVYYSV